MIRIYHNNRCGKSRCALDLLQESKQAFETRFYLQETLSQDELRQLLDLLKTDIYSIVRTKESVYKELFGNTMPDENTLIAAVSEHPILLERPIVVIGNRAWVARSEDALSEIRTALEHR